MDKNELLARARQASRNKGAEHAADKILLFNDLLRELEQCCIHRGDSKSARLRLRAKVREFRLAVQRINIELNDWNIGAEAKQQISEHLRDISEELSALDQENDS